MGADQEVATTRSIDSRTSSLGEGYKEVAAIMRQRTVDGPAKYPEIRATKLALDAVRGIHYEVMRRQIVLSPHIPGFSHPQHDAQCIARAYPPSEGAKPLTIVPVRRRELFSGPATEEQALRIELLRRSCGEQPIRLLEKEVTQAMDVLPGPTAEILRYRVTMLAQAYEHLLFSSLSESADVLRGPPARRSRIGSAVLFSSSAAAFHARAMLDIVAFATAGRWQRVNVLTPLLMFLARHAVIGLHDSKVFVLYE